MCLTYKASIGASICDIDVKCKTRDNTAMIKLIIEFLSLISGVDLLSLFLETYRISKIEKKDNNHAENVRRPYNMRIKLRKVLL